MCVQESGSSVVAKFGVSQSIVARRHQLDAEDTVVRSVLGDPSVGWDLSLAGVQENITSDI